MSRTQTYLPPANSMQFRRLFPGFSRSGARIVHDDAQAVKDRYEQVEQWLQTLPQQDQDRGRSLIQNLLAATSELQDDATNEKLKDDEYEKSKEQEARRPPPDEPRLESRMSQDRARAQADFNRLFPTASKLIRS